MESIKKIPENGRSHLCSGGSLKSRNNKTSFSICAVLSILKLALLL